MIACDGERLAFTRELSPLIRAFLEASTSVRPMYESSDTVREAEKMTEEVAGAEHPIGITAIKAVTPKKRKTRKVEFRPTGFLGNSFLF